MSWLEIGRQFVQLAHATQSHVDSCLIRKGVRDTVWYHLSEQSATHTAQVIYSTAHTIDTPHSNNVDQVSDRPGALQITFPVDREDTLFYLHKSVSQSQLWQRGHWSLCVTVLYLATTLITQFSSYQLISPTYPSHPHSLQYFLLFSD